jgi:hypothetical protein
MTLLGAGVYHIIIVILGAPLMTCVKSYSLRN